MGVYRTMEKSKAYTYKYTALMRKWLQDNDSALPPAIVYYQLLGALEMLQELDIITGAELDAERGAIQRLYFKRIEEYYERTQTDENAP